MTKTTFRNVQIGQEFRFSANPESGLLADLDRPGWVVYTKTGPRSWQCEPYGNGIASVNADVWV